MKKLLCLSVLASICLLTGCTKNYKTVGEYEDAMKTVRDSHQSYTMEVKQDIASLNMYYKTFVKDNKWKTEISMNGGTSYASGMLYDGSELLQYSQGSPYAVINPASDMLKDDNKEAMELSMSMLNPSLSLLYWSDSLDYGNAVFGNNKETKNGYECRMIQYGDSKEVCVSDKLGVAVYVRLKNDKTGGDVTYNLVKIATNDIPDSEFGLPAGIKKMDMDQMLDDLERKMKSMKFDY